VRCFILLVSVAAMSFAASPAIGVVTASGHFTLQRSEIWGNATLFDGVVLETRDASSEISLTGGSRAFLGAHSRAQVWRDHMVLERGVGQATQGYRIDAGGVRASGDTLWRVAIGDGRLVRVTSLAGRVRVTNAAGVMMAGLSLGKSLTFSQQTEGAAVTRSGCLLYKNGRYLLQDENTDEVVELTGETLRPHVGNRVEISGVAANVKPLLPQATSVLRVNSVKQKAQGGCLSVAAQLDAQTTVGTPPGQTTIPPPTPEKTGGGMSTGAKVGIAVAAAGGGAGAAIALSQGKKSTSP
jgi:hypothetical protein